MKVHTINEQRESAESFILRAGQFEQQGSSVDEYAVLIEGLRAHYDNYELYFMLGLYYRYRNADQAFLCFENALHYCDEPEDEKVIREAMEDVRDRVSVRGVSIVIVSYNDMELCRQCLYAIRRYLQTDSYEVIVVDNASTDEEVRRFLREYASGDSHVRLLENEKNEGFPVGCNIGLSAANPENDVFFLNNDAILMPNALFWLRMGLYSDKRNGSAGAVTNSAPSQEVSMESVEPYLKNVPMEESRPLSKLSANLISTVNKDDGLDNPHVKDNELARDSLPAGKTIQSKDKLFPLNSELIARTGQEHRWWRTISLDMALETAKSYAKDHNVPMWNPIEVRCRLTGFAVLLRREAIDGLLLNDEEAENSDKRSILFDERFSPGYFEDDDLGIRLCLAGWRQILCHNAFIYHHGGSGFADKKDAMEASREKFKEKWGFDIWNYTLPEEDKITALMRAISGRDATHSNTADASQSDADKDKKDSTNKTGESAENKTTAHSLKLYNRVLRILDISAGMGTTLSAIKYQMPGSFTAGVTNADVFAGLSKFMADDMISGDPEFVTFPWPEHSFDYILVGSDIAVADNPTQLMRKLRMYLRYDGQIINTVTETR